MGEAVRISIDTSFLVHATIPGQQTQTAEAALAQLIADGHIMVGAAGLFVEFPSLLRKLVTTRAITPTEADEFFHEFVDYRIEPILPSAASQVRAWETARLLNQGDTFDAMGYAVAEEVDGEFWTSDRRFANAARNAGLPRVVLVS